MMTSHESNRYEIIVDTELGETEAMRRQAAVRESYSLLGQWRSRFTDEVIDPKPYDGISLSSKSPTDAIAEVMAEDGSRLTHELSGPDGNLVVTEYPLEGEPRRIERDFVSQHIDFQKIVFDCDRREFRG